MESRSKACFENFQAGIGHDNTSPTVQGNQCFENVRAGTGISKHARPTIESGERRTVDDGPWKLIVIYGENVEYQLFHREKDPELRDNLSGRLEQIAFRMRGMIEQTEGRE